MSKRKSILVFAAVALLMVFSGGVIAGTYSGGTGEPNNPFLISNAADMNQIGANPDDWDAHFLLVADINLAEYTGTQFNIIGYWEDCGSPNNAPFTGVFDGNHHTISNFTYECSDTNCIGLFGYVIGPDAEIKNLILNDSSVDAGTGWYVGCLVGFLGGGTIIGCGVEVISVSGCEHTGGLVGNNVVGTVSDCCAAGSVDGDHAGGLVGFNSGMISNCYATGSVSGDDMIGGLVGRNHEGTISSCYAMEAVSGGSYTGGIVGDNWEGTISNCNADCNVKGTRSFTGGLVGCNVGAISDCYAVGAVDGSGYTGGLVGVNLASILNSFATGSVNGGINTGGLVGNNWDDMGSTSASFWDIETTGQSTSDGGMGKTTAEMKRQSTFTDAGWDFIEIWNIGENQTYPFLRTHPAGDINHDDIVNFYDLAIIADHWLKSID